MKIVTHNKIVKWVFEDSDEILLTNNSLKVLGKINICDIGEFDVRVFQVERLPYDFQTYLYCYTAEKGFYYRDENQ